MFGAMEQDTRHRQIVVGASGKDSHAARPVAKRVRLDSERTRSADSCVQVFPSPLVPRGCFTVLTASSACSELPAETTSSPPPDTGDDAATVPGELSAQYHLFRRGESGTKGGCGRSPVAATILLESLPACGVGDLVEAIGRAANAPVRASTKSTSERSRRASHSCGCLRGQNCDGIVQRPRSRKTAPTIFAKSKVV
jgi:hypothetical protein